MKLSHPGSKLNAQVYEEATEWLIEFRTGNPEAHVRARLEEWLRRSPEHVRAYLEVNALWEDAALHDADRKVSAEDHIARALAEDNVVALNPAERPAAVESIDAGNRDAGHPPIAVRRWAIAASVAFLCIAVGALAWLNFQRTPTYSTQTGEQRVIILEDGSTMQLNARSRARVRFSEHERTVELLAGQALFQVAKNKERPFIVQSEDVRVRAVGTQFDVYRKDGGTVVTVVEGLVAVSNAPAHQETGEVPNLLSSEEPAPIQLSAGQQVTVGAAAIPPPKQIDIAAATAWTQRRLVFDSVPLREVAEEFNRYNARQIVLEGAKLQDIAVIGVFSSTDPASLLRFLRTQPGIHVDEEDARILISEQP